MKNKHSNRLTAKAEKLPVQHDLDPSPYPSIENDLNTLDGALNDTLDADAERKKRAVENFKNELNPSHIALDFRGSPLGHVAMAFNLLVTPDTVYDARYVFMRLKIANDEWSTRELKIRQEHEALEREKKKVKQLEARRSIFGAAAILMLLAGIPMIIAFIHGG